MDLQSRKNALLELRKAILKVLEVEAPSLFIQAKNENSWFTESACRTAFEGLARMLEPEKLELWLSHYDLERVSTSRNVGLLLAGNIPAVGFHDLVCVLLSGHRVSVKLSSSDSVLMTWVIRSLIEADERMRDVIAIEPMLKQKDAYIATGSDNSSRYFDYYFGKYPHVIRKNRTSIAVLDERESVEDLALLGRDIFTYFGLGCRNVSKLYLKSAEYLPTLLDGLEGYQTVADHHKYFNNYEYNKSIYLVNKVAHLDNGFLLVKEDAQLVSPIAVIYYELYKDAQDLQQKLQRDAEKIQCVVGRVDGGVPFGQAQFPGPMDYADGVDTMRFLTQL